jgi:hypothetical protein
LTNEQESFVEQGLDRFFLTYKSQEFPKYIHFLEEIKSRSERQLTEADLKWFRDTLRQYNENIANLLVKDVSLFIGSLEKDQVPYLQTKLAESNESWLEERANSSKEERLEKRYERIEEWVGELTKKQKQEIAVLYPLDQNSNKFRYNRRLNSQQHFMKIVESGAEPQDLKAKLLGWYLKSDQYYDNDYQAYIKKRNQQTTKLVLMLDKTATKEQRKHFKEKLEGYIDELQKIISG